MSVIHTVTNFTSREISDVSGTWGFIRPNLAENGCDLFINFFATFPEYQQHFKMAAGLQLDRLRNCHALKSHAEAFMLSVSALVDNLGDASSLQPLFSKIGGIHARNNVPLNALKDFKMVFLHWLRHKLGSKAKSSAMEAWDKAMSLLVSNLVEGINLEPVSGLSVISANTTEKSSTSANNAGRSSTSANTPARSSTSARGAPKTK